VKLADAKELVKAGVEGWLAPVRDGTPDAEFIALVKERIARNERPDMWFNPTVGNNAVVGRDAWNDPLLRDTVPPGEIRKYFGEQLEKMTPEVTDRARRQVRDNAARIFFPVGDAGMKIVMGTDANPLEDIANSRKINKVFLRGTEVERAALRAKWQREWANQPKER
jgi:hypothetical protein